MQNTVVSLDGLPARTSEADIRRQDARALTRFWTSQRQFGTSAEYAAYCPTGRCRGRSGRRIPGWWECRCDSPPRSTRRPVGHPIRADGQGDGRDNPGRAPLPSMGVQEVTSRPPNRGPSGVNPSEFPGALRAIDVCLSTETRRGGTKGSCSYVLGCPRPESRVGTVTARWRGGDR
jgi:hypothetical protein